MPFTYNRFYFFFFLIIFTNSTYAVEEVPPPHLELARSAIGARLSPFDLKTQWNCYEFANQVFKLSLNTQATQEWDRLWQITLQFLPDSHWAPEIIPYHYFLIANHLEKMTIPYRYWSHSDIFHARMGDVLIYQGVDYEPDPAKRSSPEAPDSHIAFVNSVLENNGETVVLRLIDASERIQGRCFDPEKGDAPKQKGCIAYSFLTLNWRNELDGQIVWKAQFRKQRPKYLKIQILRLGSDTDFNLPCLTRTCAK